jgi:DNA mismatch endonuclease (patch repair protein)
MDRVSAKIRSRIMSRIRGRGNKETEEALAKLFRQHRIKGWRRHQPVFGKPDFIFPKSRLAVFVDGCFWHGCAKHGTIPKSNRAYWRRKLARNKKRDQIVARTLRNAGWRVIRIWYCVLQSRPQTCVERILRVLGG